jgi:hypothetical protein
MEHPANPWAGHHTCPNCRSSAWTMPADGHLASSWWVCVNVAHPTLFYTPG